MRRLFRWRRLRWFAVGAVARYVLRRSTSRSVDRAAAEIEERLPAPVRSALAAVPADAIRAGGSAVVAGRTARRFATGSRRMTRLATDGGRRVSDGVHRVRSIGDEIGHEAEQKRRELRAQYLRATRGNAAADDAMLDLRGDGPDGRNDEGYGPDDRRSDGGSWLDADEPPRVREPIRQGRWRAGKSLGSPPVSRVQRSYRPTSRPWDR